MKLAQSIDKKELQEIKTKLNQDGFERDYKIYKEDSLFILTYKRGLKIPSQRLIIRVTYLHLFH